MALGVIGLTPEEFIDLTPAAFESIVKGYFWKEEKKYKDTAWALVQIINTCGHLKKGQRMRLEKLYKRSNQDPDNPFYKALLG